jgi:hypothetical protein
MDEKTAKMIVIAGALVGAGVWILCLRYYRRMKTMARTISKEGSVSGVTKDQAMKALLGKFLTHAGNHQIPDRSDDGFTLRVLLTEIALEFQSQGAGVSFRADADMSRLAGLFGTIMGVLVIILQPLVIIAVSALLWFLVAGSETAGMRWQAIQVVQIIHVLWPPFLAYFLYRAMRSKIQMLLDNMQMLIEVTAQGV